MATHLSIYEAVRKGDVPLVTSCLSTTLLLNLMCRTYSLSSSLVAPSLCTGLLYEDAHVGKELGEERGGQQAYGLSVFFGASALEGAMLVWH